MGHGGLGAGSYPCRNPAGSSPKIPRVADTHVNRRGTEHTRGKGGSEPVSETLSADTSSGVERAGRHRSDGQQWRCVAPPSFTSRTNAATSIDVRAVDARYIERAWMCLSELRPETTITTTARSSWLWLWWSLSSRSLGGSPE